MPPPVPPRVKDGRMIAGKPIVLMTSMASGVVVGQAGAGNGQADLLHRLLEQGPVLGLLDGRQLGADQFDAELVQNPHLGHGHRRIQRRLAAQGRQDRVRALLFDDLGQDLRRDRLDVGAVGKIRVGHDGGRVAVQQHHLVALFLQRLAGLGAGIVEFAGLADDDRAGADDEDLFDVGSFWHCTQNSFVCLPEKSRTGQAAPG